MKDYLVKALAFDDQIRAFAISSTNLVEEGRRRHGCWPTASAALGRTLTVAAMMGSQLKGEETITIRINGNGPIGSIIVDADSKGIVRGYVTNPEVHFQYNSGKLNVGMAVGTDGQLSVTKDLGLKDYFTGQVPLQAVEVSFTDISQGFLNMNKVSADAALVKDNPCYSLEGAVYGVYDSIEDAKADQNRVEILTTDKNGNSNTVTLHKGIYYVKELTASKGYELCREDENLGQGNEGIHKVKVKPKETTSFTCKEPVHFAGAGGTARPAESGRQFDGGTGLSGHKLEARRHVHGRGRGDALWDLF